MHFFVSSRGRGPFGPVLCIAAALFLSSTAVAQDPPAPDAAADAAAEAPPDPPKLWEAKAALAVSWRSGDENKTAANADLEIARKWEVDKLTFRALGDYGKSGGVEDTKNASASLTHRHDFTDRLFSQARVYADTDPVQDRELRFTVDAGPGYRVWQVAGEKEYFDVMAGLGFRADRYKPPTPDRDLFDARASYKYEDTIGEVLEVVHTTEILAPVNLIENYLVKTELILAVPIVKSFFLRNNVRVEYDHRPAEGRKQINSWLTLGLEYRY